jgi:DnaJ-domain-containing protein 1
MAKGSIWTEPSRYGTYTGPRGDASQWSEAFEEARYSRLKAQGILLHVEDTPRQILGVGVDASDDEIKTAWRKLVLKHHPDHGGDVNEFRKVMAAYSLLAR